MTLTELPVDGTKPSTQKPREIVSEVTDKREQYSRHFLMNDGSFEAVSYSAPVSFLKDGKWAEIDNTLSETIDPETGAVLENKNNSFKVKFAKNADKKS